tara:strand:+ start:392 stop:1090 length:699 start_codon:yes stop_codon:yes gene_type:complete
MIDLQNSFIYYEINGAKWRTKIESILKLNTNNFYLTTHCRSEEMSPLPFSEMPRRFDVQFITAESGSETKNYIFRTTSVGGLQNNIDDREDFQDCSDLESKIKVQSREIENLNFDEVYGFLQNEINENLYIKISFNRDNKNHTLISKLNYLNFGTDKNRKIFLQPIVGRIPFIHLDKLRFGYLAINILKDNDKNGFEVILSQKTLHSSFATNDFSEIVKVDNSEIKLFRYTS